ncbi:hypothetical protein J3F83DRAFT_47193 [Trichoderma novae-zelandiae]
MLFVGRESSENNVRDGKTWTKHHRRNFTSVQPSAFATATKVLQAAPAHFCALLSCLLPSSPPSSPYPVSPCLCYTQSIALHRAILPLVWSASGRFGSRLSWFPKQQLAVPRLGLESLFSHSRTLSFLFSFSSLSAGHSLSVHSSRQACPRGRFSQRRLASGLGKLPGRDEDRKPNDTRNRCSTHRPSVTPSRASTFNHWAFPSLLFYSSLYRFSLIHTLDFGLRLPFSDPGSVYRPYFLFFASRSNPGCCSSPATTAFDIALI